MWVTIVSGPLSMSSAHKLPMPLLVAFCFSFFALGVPFWLQDYSQLTLPNSLFGVGTPVVLLSALYLRAVSNQTLRLSILAPAVAAPAVVLIRIVVEVLLMADTHNLWPFELIIAVLYGLLVAAMGGLAGALIARLRRGRS